MRLAPPTGLEAHVISSGSEEFVVFSWSVPSTLPKLSAAEREVLKWITRGASNREIARARGVALRTVANQVASILKKLAASSRYELIARYQE